MKNAIPIRDYYIFSNNYVRNKKNRINYEIK